MRRRALDPKQGIAGPFSSWPLSHHCAFGRALSSPWRRRPGGNFGSSRNFQAGVSRWHSSLCFIPATASQGPWASRGWEAGELLPTLAPVPAGWSKPAEPCPGAVPCVHGTPGVVAVPEELIPAQQDHLEGLADSEPTLGVQRGGDPFPRAALLSPQPVCTTGRPTRTGRCGTRCSGSTASCPASSAPAGTASRTATRSHAPRSTRVNIQKK